MKVTFLVLLLLTILLPICASRAWGTAQTPEILHINGREVALLTTPLDPILEPLREWREDLHAYFQPGSSGHWRGYVGTWHLEGDRLYLASLVGAGAEPEPIPLSLLFPHQGEPVPATWFTGTLRVPVGLPCRYVNQGFATTYKEELLIEVERGRVVSREILDVRQATRGRSERDLAYAVRGAHSPATSAVPPGRGWRDARAIGTAAFREQVPSGVPFVTRGVLGSHVDEDEDAPPQWLQVPRTPVTEPVAFRIRPALDFLGDAAHRRVEIDATWREEDGTVVLDVRWIRFLRWGETFHHPEHPLPELPPFDPVVDDDFVDWDDGEPYVMPMAEFLGDAEDHYTHDLHLHMRLLEVEGVLAPGAPYQVFGIDVATTPDLAGEQVVVRGELQKWIITPRLLELGHPDVQPFQSRGPGTYYRVVDPQTRTLARPTLSP